MLSDFPGSTQPRLCKGADVMDCRLGRTQLSGLHRAGLRAGTPPVPV